MKPAIPAAAILATTLALLPGSRPAAAQNSTQSPPPRSDAISGGTPAGDPNGAVRALGRADGNDSTDKPGVSVPRLGGEDADRPRRLPPGTTGPGR